MKEGQYLLEQYFLWLLVEVKSTGQAWLLHSFVSEGMAMMRKSGMLNELNEV
jgi:hypothetical protein